MASSFLAYFESICLKKLTFVHLQEHKGVYVDILSLNLQGTEWSQFCDINEISSNPNSS